MMKILKNRSGGQRASETNFFLKGKWHTDVSSLIFNLQIYINYIFIHARHCVRGIFFLDFQLDSDTRHATICTDKKAFKKQSLICQICLFFYYFMNCGNWQWVAEKQALHKLITNLIVSWRFCLLNFHFCLHVFMLMEKGKEIMALSKTELETARALLDQ